MLSFIVTWFICSVIAGALLHMRDQRESSGEVALGTVLGAVILGLMVTVFATIVA